MGPRRWLTGGAGIAVYLFVAAAGAAQTSRPVPRPVEVDVPGFLVELDRWTARIQPLEQNPSAAAALRNDVPERWVVRDSKTPPTRYDVSTGWLTNALRTAAEDPRLGEASVRDALARLSALRREAEAFAGAEAAAVADTQARVKLDAILSRREFAGAAGPSFWEQVRMRIFQWIDEMLSKIRFPLGRGRAIGEILLWVAIALTFALLAVWSYRLMRRSAPRARLPVEGAQPRSRNWRDWAQQALAAARAGDFRDAVHCAYWAGVFRLEESGAWAPDRSRTPREYLRMLPVSHQHRGPLAALTRHFELIWYGSRPATESDFQQAVGHLENLGCVFPSTLATGKS